MHENRPKPPSIEQCIGFKVHAGSTVVSSVDLSVEQKRFYFILNLTELITNLTQEKKQTKIKKYNPGKWKSLQSSVQQQNWDSPSLQNLFRCLKLLSYCQWIWLVIMKYRLYSDLNYCTSSTFQHTLLEQAQFNSQRADKGGCLPTGKTGTNNQEQAASRQLHDVTRRQ